MIFGNFRFGPRLPKHKEFNYIPRYYNQEQEEFEQRIDDLKIKYGHKEREEVKKRTPIKFHRTFQQRQTDNSKQIRRIVLIVSVLVLILYLFIR